MTTLLNVPSVWPFPGYHIVPANLMPSGRAYAATGGQILAQSQDVPLLVYGYGFSVEYNTAGALTGSETVTVNGNQDTTTQDIADLGGGASGLVLIDSGALSGQFTDIPLPVGYMLFQLFLPNTRFSARDSLVGALSFDGGTTFLNDPLNSDSYIIVSVQTGGTNPVSGIQFNDGLLGFTRQSIATLAGATGHSVATLYPGDGSFYPTLLVNYGAIRVSDSPTEAYTANSFGTVNPEAIVPPPALARANVLRLLPYGNGDCNPPTSGETFTAGSWALFGVPTP